MKRLKWSYGILLAGVGLVCFLTAFPVWAQTSLGTAEDFAVLGASTVTNTGDSLIIGELGVSPGTAVTGFPPGIVSGGTIHSNDAVAMQAQSDLTVAYNALALRACNTELTGQDLGGKTLGPGVYCFSSSAQLTGTLTLDAMGDPNAEFVFQIGSTLTTASNSRVRVINSGQDCNVFWQVGSSATLGTATSFIGNILALTSITLNTGATVSGRLLARNGAVTMDTNNVAVCPFCSPITLSPSTLPNGTIGTAYSQTITASGGTAPYTFAVISGSLPPGLALSSGGSLAGTPTTAGSFTFTVRATDSEDCFGSRIYTIVINPAPGCPAINLSPSTLPAATAGTPYNQTITASGGTAPYTFSVTSGSLPPGLSLSSGGVLSGTPTMDGSFTFTVTATDANSCLGTRNYTLLVNCPAITVSPSSLPNGTVGVAYNQTITASGGTAPFTFEVISGALPDGLALSSGGMLSGTPTTAGSSTFTIRATDSVGCPGERLYTLVINPGICPDITVSPATLPAATTGVAYNQTITASGGTEPYTFSVTAGELPPGLSLSLGGVLSGTSTMSGGYTFTVTATDANSCLGTRIYSLLVNCPTITVLPATLPEPSQGEPYSQQLTAIGGTGPYTFSVTGGALPGGITLSSSGLLSGTFESLGTFTFTITARDSSNCPGSQLYTLSLLPGGPIPTLSEWGLILLTGLLVLAGYFILRKSGRMQPGH